MTFWHRQAFGVEVEASFALPGMRGGRSVRTPGMALRLAAAEELERAWSGTDAQPLWTTVLDGCRFTLEAGRRGDHLMTYGDRARFLLSNPAGTLLCAPAEPAAPAWQRQLLDTVLLCASSLRGFELMHASAVERPEGVVAFCALSGGGKTTLAAELLRRGGRLFADDIVALGRNGTRVVCHPGPPLMNLPLAHPAAGELGKVIATFEDEGWVEIERASERPSRLAAVYLLDRRPGVETRIEPLTANPLHLMPHSVGLRHGRERHRSRFERFADVAAETPLYRLRADVRVPAAELADLVEACATSGERTPAKAV